MIIDITRELRDGMPVWPGDPQVTLRSWPSDPDGPFISSLSMGTHSGTHVDAPAHLWSEAPGVDALPLDALVGPARVILPPGPGPVTAANLGPLLGESTCERVLMATDRAADAWSGLAMSAVELLISRGIRLLGVGSDSVDADDSGTLPVHMALLRAGVVIVEGLDLCGVKPGRYLLACLPLRIHADGAPARAVLRTL